MTADTRGEDALEVCAKEINQLCADLTGLYLGDNETLITIMQRHQLRGPGPVLYWATDPSYPCPTCGHVANRTTPKEG